MKWMKLSRKLDRYQIIRMSSLSMFVVLSDHEIGFLFFIFSDIRLIFDGCVLSYDKVSELFVCTTKCHIAIFCFLVGRYF